MALQEDYRVSIDAFEGPLDLLLYLIRRAEVDITEIPIAVIADQYHAFITQMDSIDVDLAGDFLLMAATLIELKSRTLIPPEDTQPGGDGADRNKAGGAGLDPRFELVQQLLAYQRYRIASEELAERRATFGKRFPLQPTKRREDRTQQDEDELHESAPLELDDVHVMDLAEAYERIIGSIDFAKLGDHIVEMDDTPIALHQEDLLDRLGRAMDSTLTLQETFEGRPAPQRIGLFMATLELVRLRRVTVIQNEIDSPISIVLLDDDDALTIPTDAPMSAVREHAEPEQDGEADETPDAPTETCDDSAEVAADADADQSI